MLTRRFVAAVFVVAAGAITPTLAFAHVSGCHAQHTCPSDHHTYVWTDPSSGASYSCAEPGASEYNPATDTTTIVYDGRTYYCQPAGAAPPPATTTTATTTTVAPPPPTTTIAPKPTPTTTTAPKPSPAPAPTPPTSTCVTPVGVQKISFSRTKYLRIYAHVKAAIKRGWPKTLVLNRPEASARRTRLLEGIKTKPGYDRDEYPPAVARGKGAGLQRGKNPTGWKADVKLVPAHENRSQGSSLGIKLRRFCDGTKFRYVWY